MIIRFLLLSILLTIVLRAGAAVWGGIMRELRGPGADRGSGRRAGGVPQQSVQMARDPVCGTFVLPASALVLAVPGGGRVYFCSAECRDKYRARQTASPTASGRTA